MFHRFQTTQELCDVLNSAARSFAKSDDVADMRLVQEMMLGTITALRMFVNDEINQLDFGINNVATNYVAPGGILAVVVHSEVEQKLVAKLLTEVNVPDNVDLTDLVSSLYTDMISRFFPIWIFFSGNREVELTEHVGDAACEPAVEVVGGRQDPVSEAGQRRHVRS